LAGPILNETIDMRKTRKQFTDAKRIARDEAAPQPMHSGADWKYATG